MKKILSALLLTCAFALPVMAAPDFEATKRLAEQGDVYAQFELGVMYDNGLGVPENDAEAVKWFRLAADQGDAKAQLNLGVMYYNGEGVPESYTKAYALTSLAAGQGVDAASNARDIVKEILTPAQLAEGQRLAAECYERDCVGCGF